MNLYESVRNNLKESPVLNPEYSGRKSFYNKAKYTDDENGKTLRSYQTDIMRIKDGKIEMLCDENALTQTTLRHVKEFLLQNGMGPLTKQQLIKLINEQKSITEANKKWYGFEDDDEELYVPKKLIIKDPKAKKVLKDVYGITDLDSMIEWTSEKYGELSVRNTNGALCYSLDEGEWYVYFKEDGDTIIVTGCEFIPDKRMQKESEDDYEEEEDDYESIYDIADSWDGNGANDELDDSEWKEVFENAPDTYLQALSRRADFVEDWWGRMPDLVWNELEDNVKQQLGFINYDPMAVIDNVIVNGSYGDFDEYKQEDETDEDFVARVEDEVYRIFPEERFVIYSL